MAEDVEQQAPGDGEMGTGRDAYKNLSPAGPDAAAEEVEREADPLASLGDRSPASRLQAMASRIEANWARQPSPVSGQDAEDRARAVESELAMALGLVEKTLAVAQDKAGARLDALTSGDLVKPSSIRTLANGRQAISFIGGDLADQDPTPGNKGVELTELIAQNVAGRLNAVEAWAEAPLKETDTETVLALRGGNWESNKYEDDGFTSQRFPVDGEHDGKSVIGDMIVISGTPKPGGRNPGVNQYAIVGAPPEDTQHARPEALVVLFEPADQNILVS